MTKNEQPILFFICISLFLMVGNYAFSQQENYTLNRDFLWRFDNYYNGKDRTEQTFVKPYRYFQLNKTSDSVAYFSIFYNRLKIKKENKNHSAELNITPLLTAEAGYQAGAPSHFTNDLAIGGNINVYLGNNFSANLKALVGRATYTSIVDSIIRQTQVIPGIGVAYLSKKSSLNPQYAYQYFSGYASYSPNKIFNFQVGRDKHFWGDGYRSLFLSDVAAPFPFFKITTTAWHLTYVNLFTIMNDVTNPSGLKKDWLTKYATFHYLGWNVTKRLNIGLFESIVWQGSDGNRFRGYDVNYLNPVLFFRPTEYSLGSSDNALIGISMKIKAFDKQQFYGQLLLDEFMLKEALANTGWWGNKHALQVGFKSFDWFKINRLNFQTEFNYARPYTYSHGSVQQNYGHMNQPLAHPLGANFIESATFINYNRNRLFIEAKCVYALYGADSTGTDFGKNIFISYTKRTNEYGNYTTQGLQTSLITTSIRIAYVLDTKMHLKLELSIVDRVQKTTYTATHTPYVSIGIKTDLGNLYADY